MNEWINEWMNEWMTSYFRFSQHTRLVAISFVPPFLGKVFRSPFTVHANCISIFTGNFYEPCWVTPAVWRRYYVNETRVRNTGGIIDRGQPRYAEKQLWPSIQNHNLLFVMHVYWSSLWLRQKSVSALSDPVRQIGLPRSVFLTRHIIDLSVSSACYRIPDLSC
jgi:hypothetical protein